MKRLVALPLTGLLLFVLGLFLPGPSQSQQSVGSSNGQLVEQAKFANISATTASFPLRGGQYGVTVHATFSAGTVTLQRLSADGNTFVTCLTAFSADGYATVNLPQGTYQIAVATATGVYIDVTSVIIAS